MRDSTKRIALCSALGLTLGLLAIVAKATTWPAHVWLATRYVEQITADRNAYGAPTQLYFDNLANLHAVTKGGSFLTLLLKNAYPTLTNTVLIALTGSSSPYPDEWFASIDAQRADPVSHIAFGRRSRGRDIRPGDILASPYTSATRGHVMIVAGQPQITSNIQSPHPIPGGHLVNRIVLQVFDSTASTHGDGASTTPDSREGTQWNGTAFVADSGLGSGHIVLYENATDGRLLAWAWNTSQATPAFYYIATPPAGIAKEYRPLVAGFLDGL